MPVRFLLAVLAAALLPACDKLSGAADQQVADAEAVGFACRISGKTPGDCMTENDGYSPASILDGWKMADEDVRSGKIDPNMSNHPAPKAEGAEDAAMAENGAEPAPQAVEPAAAPAENQ